MVVLDMPKISKSDIYKCCCDGIRNRAKKKNLLNYLYVFLLNACGYNNSAREKYLDKYTIKEPINYKKFTRYENIKKDLFDLYNNRLVRGKEPRKYYDQIMAGSKLGKCPYCGLGHVSTLDHYLPKSEFQIFSILPNNLIGCCRDCNTTKRNTVLNTIHPYYDDFTKTQWLFAKVNWSELTMEFFVGTKDINNALDKKKIEEHFRVYELARRYAIEAASELSDLRIEFENKNLTKIDIEQEL
ncbi:HNH endonuclease, partial [Campylobacter concisus]|uniref:HNH endonuclease n=1 Tax=Campylobacter concisus TaxID=199 RepID=UPI001CA4A4AD